MTSAPTSVVTGGCGFIGTHLVRALLAAGHRVRVIDDLSTGDAKRLPSEADLIVGDVVDPDLVRRIVPRASEVYHLAAIAAVQRSNERWQASHRVNSGGTVTVLEAIRDLAPEASFVYASSAAVYGDMAGREPASAANPIRETEPGAPIAPYGVDKLASEMHARAGSRLFGLRTVGLRFFNVYGSGQAADSPYSGVITKFLGQLRSGGPITVFGDGLQTRDFVNVDDVVRALLLAAAQAGTDGDVVNICTGRGTSIRHLAEMMASLGTARTAIETRPPQPGDIRHSVGDFSRAHDLLGWQPEVELREGLSRLVVAS